MGTATRTDHGDRFREHIRMAGFVLLAAPVLLGPWFFGAWERWWFWPFVVLLCGALACFAAGLWLADAGAMAARPGLVLWACVLPFLAYAAVRACQAPVRLDAERAFLLHATAVAVAAHVVYGLTAALRRALYALVMVNLGALGVYGVVNHILNGSRSVLWAPGFPQYIKEGRASGSYFCPDHFAGIMELACATGLGVLLTRRLNPVYRLLGFVLCAIGVAGVILSRSRGGGMALVVLAAAALVWGLGQWPADTRWWHRLSLVAATGILLATVWTVPSVYMTRFKEHFNWPELRGLPPRALAQGAWHRLSRTPRGLMIGGALRAWHTAPVFGIGPGMHRNIWPHVAASADGNRAEGIRPSVLNDTFHSYEVHSDWMQLLEEYGLVGLALFLLAAGAVLGALLAALYSENRRWRNRRRGAVAFDSGARPYILGALFALAAMAFHSLGDFNLQMPATVWILAAVTAVPLGEFLATPDAERVAGA